MNMPCIWNATSKCENDADFFGATVGSYYAICEAHAKEWEARDRTPVKRVQFDQPMPTSAIIYCPKCDTQISSGVPAHLKACDLTFTLVTEEEVNQASEGLLKLLQTF